MPVRVVIKRVPDTQEISSNHALTQPQKEKIPQQEEVKEDVQAVQQKMEQPQKQKKPQQEEAKEQVQAVQKKMVLESVAARRAQERKRELDLVMHIVEILKSTSTGSMFMADLGREVRDLMKDLRKRLHTVLHGHPDLVTLTGTRVELTNNPKDTKNESHASDKTCQGPSAESMAWYLAHQASQAQGPSAESMAWYLAQQSSQAQGPSAESMAWYLAHQASQRQRPSPESIEMAWYLSQHREHGGMGATDTDWLECNAEQSGEMSKSVAKAGQGKRAERSYRYWQRMKGMAKEMPHAGEAVQGH